MARYLKLCCNLTSWECPCLASIHGDTPKSTDFLPVTMLAWSATLLLFAGMTKSSWTLSHKSHKKENGDGTRLMDLPGKMKYILIYHLIAPLLVAPNPSPFQKNTLYGTPWLRISQPQASDGTARKNCRMGRILTAFPTFLSPNTWFHGDPILPRSSRAVSVVKTLKPFPMAGPWELDRSSSLCKPHGPTLGRFYQCESFKMNYKPSSFCKSITPENNIMVNQKWFSTLFIYIIYSMG